MFSFSKCFLFEGKRRCCSSVLWFIAVSEMCIYWCEIANTAAAAFCSFFLFLSCISTCVRKCKVHKSGLSLLRWLNGQQVQCWVQGVFTSLYGGVGGGLGGLFGGFVYSTYGAAAVFQMGLLVISIGWVLCTICQAVAQCVCSTPSPDICDSDA